MPRIPSLAAAARAVPAGSYADAESVHPLSRPRDVAKIDRLVSSMGRTGWVGPPLVASGTSLLTGAHRHAAALILGLPVPVVRVGLSQAGRDLLSETTDDADRLSLLLMYGADGPGLGSLDAATTLLRDEAENG